MRPPQPDLEPDDRFREEDDFGGEYEEDYEGDRDTIREALLAVPRFGLLLFRLMRDPRVSLFDRWLFGATLAYVFLPIDLLPDWLLGMGALDDVLVVAIALDRLIAGTDEEILLEHWEGDPEPLLFLERLLGRASAALPPWGRRLLGEQGR